ncbi:kinase-like domain-containing protein [Roridomyces roridus]|uniref:Kinase-like domain-containing protein n=1 Tax=Roridomyces roridus TaxID=1738132 RepID=A0AAD7BCM7_9AGAR|nr:kinase-like domain-containing protein [Roridomyces roridus]
MIQLLTTEGSADRSSILEVCDRVSKEETARQAIRTLMQEFQQGTTAAQLSAASLWGILLHNSSTVFISQSGAPDFLETLEALVLSPQTTEAVRARVLQVLGDTVYRNPTRDVFHRLWVRLKPSDQPEKGSPYSDCDDILRPSASHPSAGTSTNHSSAQQSILDRASSPVDTHLDLRFPPTWEPPPTYESSFIHSTNAEASSTHDFSSVSDSEDCPMEHPMTALTPLRSDQSHIHGSRNRQQPLPFPPMSPPLPLVPRPTFRQRQQTNLEGSLNAQLHEYSNSPTSGDAPMRTRSRSSPAQRRLPLAPGGSRSNTTMLPEASHKFSGATMALEEDKTLIYHRTFNYLQSVAFARSNLDAMSRLENLGRTERPNTLDSAVNVLKYRGILMEISTSLEVTNDPDLEAICNEDQVIVVDILLSILSSVTDQHATLLALDGQSALSILDIMQDTLDKCLLIDEHVKLKAQKTIEKLVRSSHRFPSSLFISGVTQREHMDTCFGGFGDVYKAMYQGSAVALKLLRGIQSSKQQHVLRQFRREALVWKRLCHPNIVPLLGIDKETFDPFPCMVSPWMPNGTVIEYLSKFQHSQRQKIVDQLIPEIAQGLAFLHEQNVVHGDLRGSNILVNGAGHACLTDFGLSVITDMTASSQTNHGHGSVRWMAPEVFQPPEDYDLETTARRSPSDVYAFGCVCLELHTGLPPFHGTIVNNNTVILRVMLGSRPSRPPGNLISDQLWETMTRCWSAEIAQRPSIIDILLGLGSLPSSLIIQRVTQREDNSSSGPYSDVYKAVHQGKSVALRRMRMTEHFHVRSKFCREAIEWKRLRHDYIVPLLGIDAESFTTSLCMVSPWMQHGTVIHYLSTITESHQWQSTVNNFISEIAQGLSFLHVHNIVHGDLRGCNVLVTDSGHACLTDFGLAGLLDTTTSTLESFQWTAPEVLQPEAHGLEKSVRGTPSDIYALGCVCLELHTGKPPFHGVPLSHATLIMQITVGLRPPRPPGHIISDQLWNIIQKCWLKKFSQRLSIQDVIQELILIQDFNEMHFRHPVALARRHGMLVNTGSIQVWD